MTIPNSIFSGVLGCLLIIGIVRSGNASEKSYWMLLQNPSSQNQKSVLLNSPTAFTKIKILIPGKSKRYFATGLVKLVEDCQSFIHATGELFIRREDEKNGTVLPIKSLPLGIAKYGTTESSPWELIPPKFNKKFFFKNELSRLQSKPPHFDTGTEIPPIYWRDIDGDGTKELIYSSVCGNRMSTHHFIYEYDSTSKGYEFTNPVELRGFIPNIIPQRTLETDWSSGWCLNMTERFTSLNGRYTLTQLYNMDYRQTSTGERECFLQSYNRQDSGKLCLTKEQILNSEDKWVDQQQANTLSTKCVEYKGPFIQKQSAY